MNQGICHRMEKKIYVHKILKVVNMNRTHLQDYKKTRDDKIKKERGKEHYKNKILRTTYTIIFIPNDINFKINEIFLDKILI